MDTLPPLDEVFSPARNNARTLSLLRDTLGIASMAPLTMLSVDEIGGLEFIIDMDAKRISNLMGRHGVPQRKYNEAAASFVVRAFGDAWGAPVGVLHVAMVRHETTDRAVLAPLQLLSVLERAMPEATVRDLMDLTHAQVLELNKAANWDNPELRCDRPEWDIMHLSFRLYCLGLIPSKLLARA